MESTTGNNTKRRKINPIKFPEGSKITVTEINCDTPSLIIIGYEDKGTRTHTRTCLHISTIETITSTLRKSWKENDLIIISLNSGSSIHIEYSDERCNSDYTDLMKAVEDYHKSIFAKTGGSKQSTINELRKKIEHMEESLRLRSMYPRLGP